MNTQSRSLDEQRVFAHCIESNTSNPFLRLAAFPECPDEELRIIAQAVMAAQSSDDVWAGLRLAKRLTGLDAARWLNGIAFFEYVESNGGHVYWDELQPFAALYMGETP